MQRDYADGLYPALKHPSDYLKERSNKTIRELISKKDLAMLR